MQLEKVTAAAAVEPTVKDTVAEDDPALIVCGVLPAEVSSESFSKVKALVEDMVTSPVRKSVCVPE